MNYDDVKPGMLVKVIGKFPSHSDGWDNTWSENMTKFIGEIFTVFGISKAGVHVEETSYAWPWQVLELTKDQEKPIKLDKQYTTKDGREVVLYCIDAPGEFPIHGRVDDMARATSWTKEGKHCSQPLLSLVEVNLYTDFKIDDPIMVRDGDREPYKRRYFAGVAENGDVLAFAEGGTSWTTSTTLRWKFGRKPIAEELLLRKIRK